MVNFPDFLVLAAQASWHKIQDLKGGGIFRFSNADPTWASGSDRETHFKVSPLLGRNGGDVYCANPIKFNLCRSL